MIIVSVARDFTRFPKGRYKKDGPTSGEEFSERFLLPHLKANEEVTVQMDGTLGYGSSFLEQAFGGAVRDLKLTRSDVERLLVIEAKDVGLVAEIREYLDQAVEEVSKVSKHG